MIINIIKAYGKWKPGATPDVTPELASQLEALGIASVHGDQTRRDYTPKPTTEEPTPMVVNNYFLAPELEEENDTEQ
jgi:hypothetical protein